MSVGRSAGLTIRYKGGNEATVALDRSPFVLGRGGSDMDLKDSSVSRRHCEFRSEDGVWLVRDLGSSNGTFLNGERVSEHALKEGDSLKLGQTEVVFHVEIPASGRLAGRIHEAALWSVVELSVGAADREQWLRDFLGIISKRFISERAFVVEYEASSGVARPIAALHGDYGKDGPGKEAPLSHTIVEQVVHEKRPIVTTDADVDPRFREAQSVDKYEIRTVVCAPIRWQGEVKGAIYLERKFSKEAYTEEDAKELQDLADLLGVALYAWRGHLAESRSEWEKDRLGRIFSPGRSKSIIAAGGINSIRRKIIDASVIRIHVSQMRQLVDGSKEEAWRMVSQLMGQVHEIIKWHGGAILGEGYGVFEGGDAKEVEAAVESARAGIEVQKAARAIQKHMMKEQQIGISVGAGISGGDMIAGLFGAGQHADYYALGDAAKVASMLAYQANDGEILIDQVIYGKVHLFMETTRVAPISVPGFDQQVQVYRVVSY